MKRLLVFFLICSVATLAQVPQPAIFSLKAIGGNNITQVSKFVTPTADGGFVIMINTNANPGSGNTDSFCALSGQRHIFVKYNSDASIVDWTKCYEIDGDTSLDYLFPQSDGGVVLGGTCTAGGYYICKQDALGHILWSHEYSKGTSLGLRSMIATGDGGYVMGGESYYTDSNVYIHYGSWMDADMFIIKLDSNGKKQWTKVVGGSDDDLLYSVIAGPRNSYYILASLASSDHDCTGNHGGPDGYIARLDSDGSLMWHRDVGGSSGDGLSAAIAATNGGVQAIGTTYSIDGDVTHHKGGSANFWLLNIDSAGNVGWDSCYGGGGYESSNGICKAMDGTIWIAGISGNKGADVDSGYGGQDAWFVHVDSMGKFIDAKVLGSSGYDRGFIVWPLSNGHVLGGGDCQKGDGMFASISTYGGSDGFLVDFGQFRESVRELAHPEMRLFPNPANEFVHVTMLLAERYDIIVTDVTGRQFYRGAQQASGTSIDVKEWPRGMYCVLLTNNRGYEQRVKLLIR